MTKLVFLKEGDTTFVQGSGKKPYVLRKIGGVVDCSCPAWRTMGGPIDVRVCKHIKKAIDPKCLLPQATAVATVVTKPTVKYTKTGKISTAVGGAVVKDTAPPVLLAHKWEDERPEGYWVSEKLDGVRAWWNGKEFISRLGNTYHAPVWFTKQLPKNTVLDGELWVGRGMFQKTISAVRKLVPTDSEWKKVAYVVFDAPEKKGTFEARMKFLKGLYPEMKLGSGKKVGQVCILEQVKCKGAEHLKQILTKVEARGGEGVMLREVGSFYEEGRSKTLLKVKSFFDAEAEVTGHIKGKGKHKGRLGALQCQIPGGKSFAVGSGFTDRERENPPKVGSTITYRFQELTRDGVPRFPVYIAVRDYE